jgi:LmbE family N-acetylglucosaminyl deacetylase
MKALCLVAHPDDCLIFAYSYIYNHPEMDWTIGYLTYTAADARGQEISAFWQRRDIPCVFLGYVDDYRDLETRKISFDTVAAAQDLQALASQSELVLTHDHNGDYGHLHHVFVHNCVRDHKGLVTFADLSTGTVTYTVPPGTYTWDELPQHQGVVRAFFPETHHQNNYNEVAK